MMRMMAVCTCVVRSPDDDADTDDDTDYDDEDDSSLHMCGPKPL